MQAFLKTGKTTSTIDKYAPSTSGEAVQQQKRQSHASWVEKYRPKIIEDVVEQSEVVAVLRQCLNGADLPNMLLYGPPGTGKTSTILAAARQLFGDISKERILELNASDERGINVVRSKIKMFAQFTASGIRPDGKPCPPFKIIILDEADSMTQAAQSALRRTMEKESRNTRFCLICNYVSRIIEPITSRCTKFRFKPLCGDKVIERLKYICKKEELNMTKSALKLIVEISGGDMRRAITTLQSCYWLMGGSGTVSEEDIYEMSGTIPNKYLIKFLETCKNKGKLNDFVEDLDFEAYSAGQMMEQINEFILKSTDLTNTQKSVICDKLGECSFRIHEGASEYLQMMSLGYTISTALQSK